MVWRPRRGRLVASLNLFAAATGLTPVAQGDVTTGQTCAAAFSAGPDLVRQGHLIEGRAELRRCASGSCPAAMSALCADDLRRLELRIPSVVFAATDDRGADLTAVRVSEDGKVLADRIDGRALELDPGPHRFRFDRDTGTLAATAETPPGPSSTTVSIVVREGEKNRVVNARLPSGAAPPIVPASPTRPIGWPIYLSGGLTLAAAGAYASFGILGLEERGDLSSCKGTCDPGAVDTAWNHLRVADGFLAATIVGATVSVVLYIIRPKVTKVEVGAGSPSCSLTGRF